MKRIVWLVAVACLLLSIFGLAKVSAQTSSLQNLTIESFTADYYLDKNAQNTSTLHTVENIVAKFPDYDQNHGILRALPETYLGHTTSLALDSVTDSNGRPLNYSKSHENDNLVLKIGDAKKYVHGTQTYVITYDQKNVIDFQQNYDLFNWDVNGDQWSQTFNTVSSREHVASSISGSLFAGPKCFVGYSDSHDESRCLVSQTTEGDGELITATANMLEPGETMTILQKFNLGTFVLGPEIAQEKTKVRNTVVAAIGIAAAVPLIFTTVLYSRWRKFGDDPKGRGVIVPQYEPPKSLNTLTADFILKEQMRGKAISAMLIDEAVKRRMTIIEIPKKGIFGSKDYELRMEIEPSQFSDETLEVINLLFDSQISKGSSVKLSEIRSRSRADQDMYKKWKKIEKNIAQKLTVLGYFIKDPVKVKKSYKLWASLPFYLGFGLMISSSFLSTYNDYLVILAVGLGAGLLLAGIAMFAFSFIMPARTLAGVEARDEILGLKEYIKLAEADRLKYTQSPDGAEKVKDDSSVDTNDPKWKIKLFEQLLPYALLFGLEKDWAKQFDGIYKDAPDWYRGDWTTFNAVYLAQSVSGFSSAPALSFSSPSSSSGGGGGAGGGGGGGGGGGW